jgi:hypothetical protein
MDIFGDFFKTSITIFKKVKNRAHSSSGATNPHISLFIFPEQKQLALFGDAV